MKVKEQDVGQTYLNFLLNARQFDKAARSVLLAYPGIPEGGGFINLKKYIVLSPSYTNTPTLSGCPPPPKKKKKILTVGLRTKLPLLVVYCWTFVCLLNWFLGGLRLLYDVWSERGCTFCFIMKIHSKSTNTVRPRLSGHQLSGYLYYPAMILQYIVYFQLLKSCSRQKQSS